MTRILVASTVLVFAAGVFVNGQSAQVAPTGTLRAAFLATNPVHARVDARTGEISGPVADLVQELARRLGVPSVLIPAPNAAGVIQQIRGGTADVGFLAYDAARAREVDFAGAFALMFNTYVVPAASPLRTVADADRPGMRIGAVKGQTPQIHLSDHLQQARLQPFETTPDQRELERLLGSGELDAFALNQQRALEAAVASRGAVRALTGSFVDVEQSFVVRKGDAPRAAFLAAFVEELKTSGFIAASIERAKLSGVSVAPARPK